MLVNDKLDEDFIRANFIGFYSDTFLDEVKEGEPPSDLFFGYDKSGTLTVDEDMSYEAYLRGTGYFEGTGEKDSAWAAQLRTGVPAKTIEELAELYLDGPCATIEGWGPQRNMAGGNISRAIGLIAAITKNVGIKGGGTGARENVGGVPDPVPGSIPNLAEKNTVDRVVSFFDWYQAIVDYKSMDDTTWGVRAIDKDGVTALRRRARDPEAQGTHEVHVELCLQCAYGPARRQQQDARDPQPARYRRLGYSR